MSEIEVQIRLSREVYKDKGHIRHKRKKKILIIETGLRKERLKGLTRRCT
jgi:hypothetical protein